MRRSSVFLAALALMVCGIPTLAQSPPPAPATAAVPAIDPVKERLIRQLLEVTGTSKLMQQMDNQMFTSMQTSMPDVPADVWTKMRARFKSDEMITLLIPVYDKYYSTDELNGLLAFYKSPLGQKVIATLPKVSQESMQIGQAWGQKQAREVMAQIEQEQKAAKKHSGTSAKTM